jgi:hypothetical protein
MSSKKHPANRRQPAQPRREIRPTPTKSASGIPYWPARDPIEEEGGLNLYSFVGNDGVDWWDILGESDVGYVPHPTQMVKSFVEALFLGGTKLWVALVTRCYCDKSKKVWYTYLQTYRVSSEIIVRTHIAYAKGGRATNPGSLIHIPRSPAAVRNSLDHEQKHADLDKEHYETTLSEVEEDFAETNQFSTCEACQEYRLGKVKKWNDDWLSFNKRNIAHDFPVFAGYRGGISGIDPSEIPSGYSLANDFQEGYRGSLSIGYFRYRDDCK